MSPQPPRNSYKVYLYGVLAVCGCMLLLAVKTASAHEATTHENSGVPCAILENFGGNVELLDPSRTRVFSLSKHTGIPCGGWVSTSGGWAIVHHRDGHDLRLGPNTFLEIPESHPDDGSDQVVLYRGEMFGSTEGGAGELRIITANARVRVKHGTALINFSPDEQDTQLVALDQPAWLENRFEPEKKMEAKAGEATSLNFKQLRVVPTFPKAVSIASLRGKMSIFHVGEKEQGQYYETAQARAERRLAADLSTQATQATQGEGSAETGDSPKHEDEKVVSDRRIASESPIKPAVQKKQYDYRRSTVDAEQGMRLKADWAKRMTGGENVGERILFPDKFYGKPQKSKVLVSDPAASMNAKKEQAEDAEKKRLLKELSQIQE